MHRSVNEQPEQESEEDAQLRNAIAQSLQEQELLSKQQELEDAAMKQALQMSLALEQEFKTMKNDIEQAISDAQTEIDAMNKELEAEEALIKEQLTELQAASTVVNQVIQQTSELAKENPVAPVGKVAIKLQPLTNAPQLQDTTESPAITTTTTTVTTPMSKPSQDDIEKRVQFLQTQKEKLVKQKQQERETEALQITNVVIPAQVVAPKQQSDAINDTEKLKLRLQLAQQLKEKVKN